MVKTNIASVESQHSTHRKIQDANILLSRLREHQSKKKNDSFRIGISGAPGVGKSTFIDRYGDHLIKEGHKVAVLAIDPSSPASGGSLLGDKTRMGNLSSSLKAYIRPSPTSGVLGGIHLNTNETIFLCESAGYDRILVETVGVGQSEIAISNSVDMILLLLLPAGGDEIQGLKKGIMEIADLIVVTKNDNGLKNNAKFTERHYNEALKMMRAKPGWIPRALTYSAIDLDDKGFDSIALFMEEFFTLMKGNGSLERNRKKQQERTFHSLLENEIVSQYFIDSLFIIRLVNITARQAVCTRFITR